MQSEMLIGEKFIMTYNHNCHQEAGYSSKRMISMNCTKHIGNLLLQMTDNCFWFFFVFFCFSTLQENHLFEGHLWRWGPHGQPHLRQLALLSPSCARRTGKWSLRPVAVGHGPSSLGLPFALPGLQSGLLKLLSSSHTEPHLGSAAHKRAKLNCWI